MFQLVQSVSDRWVNDQISILADTEVLITCVDSSAGDTLRGFVERFALVDPVTRAAICKDHVFHAWVTELKGMAIEAGQNENVKLDRSRIISIVGLLHLTLSVLQGTEAIFRVVPRATGKVLLPVTGMYFEHARDGRDERLTECRYDPLRSEVVVGHDTVALVPSPSHRWIKVAHDHFECFADPGGLEYGIEYDTAIEPTQWLDAIAGALDYIAAHDVAAELVRAFVSYVVPLKQKEARTNLSFSARHLPNVIFKNNELSPLLVGETLVHEADHQMFYALETVGDLWSADAVPQTPTWFSPWRDDPRPLDGIFRGLSAFARVAGYYSAVLEACQLSAQEVEVVGAMLLTRLKQTTMAMATVRQAGQLSDFGVEYLQQIGDALTRADQAVQTRPQYERWRSKASELVESHRKRWDRRLAEGD